MREVQGGSGRGLCWGKMVRKVGIGEEVGEWGLERQEYRKRCLQWAMIIYRRDAINVKEYNTLYTGTHT